MNMRTKIAGLGSALVAGTGLALAVLVVVQRASLARQLKPLLRQQAEDAAAAFLQSVQEQCENAQRQVQDRLMHSLKVAEDALQKAGGFRLDGETVAWQAVNQFTKETRSVVLPRAYVGATWLSPSLGIDQHAPVVDDVKYYTRDAATVFQRMNEEGDLLRVTTSVLHTDGRRAIGTYIPHRNPDGSPNAVVSAILKGEDYRGRAFVVNQWYDTLYRPLWDESHRRAVADLEAMIGMKTATEAPEPHPAGSAGNGVVQTRHAGSAHDGGSRSSFTHGNGKHPGRLGGRAGSSAPDVPGTPVRA